MSRLSEWLVLAMLLAGIVCGCAGDAASNPGGAPLADFAVCRDRSLAPTATQAWRHTLTDLVVATGDANHSAQDVIASPSIHATLVGKFSYGLLSADLADETVRVFLDQCDGWHELGDATTDSDGRLSLEVPDRLGPGLYEARFQVLGDATSTTSYLYILPEGTRLTLTDIDGTLTASDYELYQQILDGTHVPVAYPGAVELTQAHARKGWIVVYLTGRPWWLTQRTRDWQRELGFSLGPLHVADSNAEALPSATGVGAYKLAFIQQLLDSGYVIDFGYGNAVTDISAYLGAGIPAERVWIIGDQAGQNGTNAVADSWGTRVSAVEELEVVQQPFE